MTAEPRMEDLLASIRRAINEDIGDVPPARAAAGKSLAARTADPAKLAEDISGPASEIQQLRAKITRARAAAAGAPPAEPVQRSASLSAALQNDTPRRAWREIEPSLPQSRLRGSTSEADPVRNVKRPSPLPRNPAPFEPPVHRIAVDAPRMEAPVILSGNSAQSVQTAFSRLADTVLSRATGDRSIEDMTRELLRGMLKQWLDDNLPAMVERMVREEIERVARTGR